MTERRKLGAVEGRLYIIAVLAAAYVATWRVLDRPAASSGAAAEPEQEPAPTLPPANARALWLDDLPAEQRPATITVPPGWRIASPDGQEAAPAKAAPQLVRVPVQRPRRVRTRSS